MEAAGAELLEVGGLAGADERLVRLATVERIGLQPFLAARDAVGSREGLDLVQAGVQILITAWPASGDKVLPSDSYVGQVTIMPTMPSGLEVIGQALLPVIGSKVPASELLTGMLNMS